jgi:hypothetical protein
MIERTMLLCGDFIMLARAPPPPAGSGVGHPPISPTLELHSEMPAVKVYADRGSSEDPVLQYSIVDPNPFAEPYSTVFLQSIAFPRQIAYSRHRAYPRDASRRPIAYHRCTSLNLRFLNHRYVDSVNMSLRLRGPGAQRSGAA